MKSSLVLACGALAVVTTVARAEPPVRTPITVADRAALESDALATGAGASIPAAALANFRATEPAAVQAGNGEGQLQVLAKALRDYRAAFGANPVGNNAEVAKTLRGSNPRGLRFADDTAAPLSEAGEVLDRWGHALYFHPISATVMEVRSAGPDGRMWTTDDLVAR